MTSNVRNGDQPGWASVDFEGWSNAAMRGKEQSLLQRCERGTELCEICVTETLPRRIMAPGDEPEPTKTTSKNTGQATSLQAPDSQVCTKQLLYRLE